MGGPIEGASMTVIQFPARGNTRSMDDFLKQAPATAIDQRKDELMPRAREVMKQFPPEAIAVMLAYAAARLERTGFKMFA
jgi:hypothetical protein